MKGCDQVKIKCDHFLKNFPDEDGIVYLEDSVMWYIIDAGIEDWYEDLSIHEKINVKHSYFQTETECPF